MTPEGKALSDLYKAVWTWWENRAWTPGQPSEVFSPDEQALAMALFRVGASMYGEVLVPEDPPIVGGPASAVMESIRKAAAGRPYLARDSVFDGLWTFDGVFEAGGILRSPDGAWALAKQSPGPGPAWDALYGNVGRVTIELTRPGREKRP